MKRNKLLKRKKIVSCIMMYFKDLETSFELIRFEIIPFVQK